MEFSVKGLLNIRISSYVWREMQCRKHAYLSFELSSYELSSRKDV